MMSSESTNTKFRRHNAVLICDEHTLSHINTYEQVCCHRDRNAALCGIAAHLLSRRSAGAPGSETISPLVQLLSRHQRTGRVEYDTATRMQGAHGELQRDLDMAVAETSHVH